MKQREILSNCEKESSNDRIRNILLLIYERDSYYVNNSEDNHKESTVSVLSSSSWDSYSFWECAENELLQKVIMDTIENNYNEDVIDKEHIVTHLSHQQAIKIINHCDGLNTYTNRFDLKKTNSNYLSMKSSLPTNNNNNNECSGSPSESSQYSASSTSSSSSPETAHTNMALDPSIPSMKLSRNKYSSAMINNIKTNNA